MVMKILIAKGNHMLKFRWLFGKRLPIIAQKILLRHNKTRIEREQVGSRSSNTILFLV